MMKKQGQSFLASPKREREREREKFRWWCGDDFKVVYLWKLRWKENGLDLVETIEIEFDWNGMDEEEHKKLALWIKGKWNGMDWIDDDGPCVIGIDGREGKISVWLERRERKNII